MSAIIINGEDIRKTRKARGMTQEQAAAAVGVTHSAFGQWERGQTNVAPKVARRLAAWLAQPTAVPVSDDSTHYTTTIPLPPKLADIASELGVDIAQLYASVGTEAVREELKRLWKEANAEAIRHNNAYYEKHGLPLAEYRMRYWR